MAGTLEPGYQLTDTVDLIARARAGDSRSANALFERCLPPLRRWARGRLPQYARELADTHDLVQETVLHTLHRLDAFEARGPGALLAYLRQAIYNRIRDEIRRVRRRPVATTLDEAYPDRAASPLDLAIGREDVERYEAAMKRLQPADREAIVARLELQQSYEEAAVTLGKATPDAARMAIKRALARLAAEMTDGR